MNYGCFVSADLKKGRSSWSNHLCLKSENESLLGLNKTLEYILFCMDMYP